MPKVIIVTDGDRVATRAVETAAAHLGLRCISASSGNPTPIPGRDIAAMVRQASQAAGDETPVVVMVDDRGHHGIGKGEKALLEFSAEPDMEILGVVAVASNTDGVPGTTVDFSIDQDGQVVDGPVDNSGVPEESDHKRVEGDTTGVVDRIGPPVVVGLGDVGKMGGADAPEAGAKITERALAEILRRSALGRPARGQDNGAPR